MATDEQDWIRDKARFRRLGDPADATGDPGHGPLAREFARLTHALLDAPTVADALEQVADVALRVVPGAALVSVTLRSPDGEFHTPIETDPVATELDRVQYKSAEGPCVEAARPSGPGYVCSTDLATEPAWPTFGPAAAAHGYVAVLSTALVHANRPPQQSGALNIYAHRHGVLDDQARDVALLLATHASLSLAETDAVSRAELVETQLRRAVASRDVIGQAKGILMSRRGISADDAFELLRRTSQQLNVKLTELAEALTRRPDELELPE